MGKNKRRKGCDDEEKEVCDGGSISQKEEELKRSVFDDWLLEAVHFLDDAFFAMCILTQCDDDIMELLPSFLFCISSVFFMRDTTSPPVFSFTGLFISCVMKKGDCD